VRPGVKFRGQGDTVLYLSNPEGEPRGPPGHLDESPQLNELKAARGGRRSEFTTSIEQYETGLSDADSVAGTNGLSKEPKGRAGELWPAGKEQGSLAYNCLMARRLVERGVGRAVEHAG